jgi:hypothetical protein
MTEAEKALKREHEMQALAKYAKWVLKVKEHLRKAMVECDDMLRDATGDPNFAVPAMPTIAKEAIAPLPETQMANLKTQIVEAMRTDVYPYTTCSLLAEKLKWDVAHVSSAIAALRRDGRIAVVGGRGQGQKYSLIEAPGPEQANGSTLFENSED